MSIKDCYPMRKRRSVDKTPVRSTSSYDGRLRTPRRITSNHSLAEQGLDVIWDNSSPSPSRTLMLGKRKKHVGSDSSSSGGEISDLVKKLADKTGQTPTNNSLLNYWLEEEVNQSDTANDKNSVEKVKSVKKKSQSKTPCRRPRELRKSRRNKNKLSKELEILASMIQDTENVNNDNPSSSVSRTSTSSSIIVKPIMTDNTHQTCSKSTDKKDRDTNPSSCVNTETLSTAPLPSVDEFGDIDWEDDEEGDVMLSQVDISALCNDKTENQVFTNTQLFDVQENLSPVPDKGKDSKDNSFVTESWDFDDLEDEDNLLQTLEEVERTQIPVISNIPSNPPNILVEQNKISVENKAMDVPFKSKPSCSKEEIERKKLQAQQKLKQKQKNHTRQNMNRLKKVGR